MIVYNWNQFSEEIKSGKIISDFKNGCGISIGSFDGLHLGHRQLLQTLVENCKKKNLQSGLISFTRPLPSYKHSEDYQGDLTTLEQRIFLFKKLGIDFLVLVEFNEGFSKIDGVEFLTILKNSFNMKFIAEGVDFRCGYKGATDVSSIKYFAQNHDVQYDFLDPVFYKPGTDEEERISSSFIRTMISKRFFLTANELLKRPYSLELKFENQDLTLSKKNILQVLPPVGVYHCKVKENDVRLEIFDEYIKCETPQSSVIKLNESVDIEFV